MTTEILNKRVPLPSTDIRTKGVFSLTRRLTPDETNFLTKGSQSKLKRALLIRNARLVDEVLKDIERPADLLNLLSFVSYIGQTFIMLESKGSTTPELATSAIQGLEELFSLPVFSHGSKPIQISFGSATFRISDTEFYKVSYSPEGQREVQSGMLTPVWNEPIIVDKGNSEL